MILFGQTGLPSMGVIITMESSLAMFVVLFLDFAHAGDIHRFSV
jgi:hypothetical protein